MLNKRGFTLVEVLVAMGITILITGGIVSIFLYSIKSNKVVWEQLSTQNEGRKAIQDFTNELRTATASSIGAYSIATAEANSIIFYSNIDTDSLRERVRYFLDGVILKKGVIKPTGNPLSYVPANEVIVPVVHDIANGANPIFVYYDENYEGGVGTPLIQPVDVTKIRMVKISLDMEEDPNASPVPFHIETKVEIRNLKSN